MIWVFFVNVVCGNRVIEEGSPYHVKMPPFSDGMAMK